jgi:hypothetical protein
MATADTTSAPLNPAATLSGECLGVRNLRQKTELTPRQASPVVR